jgi:hypothetical protein
LSIHFATLSTCFAASSGHFAVLTSNLAGVEVNLAGCRVGFVGAGIPFARASPHFANTAAVSSRSGKVCVVQSLTLPSAPSSRPSFRCSVYGRSGGPVASQELWHFCGSMIGAKARGGGSATAGMGAFPSATWERGDERGTMRPAAILQGGRKGRFFSVLGLLWACTRNPRSEPNTTGTCPRDELFRFFERKNGQV